jgi:ribosomal protein S18 acetylase RimI-like enzyme
MVPGQVHLSVPRQLALLPAFMRAWGRATPRLVRLLAKMDSMHPREPEHWYLPFIGVDPDWQGRGIGTALLSPVLERCDRDGLPAYLEASTERNRACYERNGFEVVEEYRVADDGPPGWRMWREPKSA